MARSVFGNKSFSVKPPSFTPATINDFSGGLNVVDNDVTMKTKFATVFENVERDVDGSAGLRYGTAFKYDIAGIATGVVVDLVYFRAALIIVSSTGQIVMITDGGVRTKIWDNTIAAALPGAPAGWGNTFKTVNFHEFKGDLLIHNGVDKPLIVNKTYQVKYLNDPASGSNINTPTGKFGTTVSNFSIVAGVASAPGDIYISSSGTSGVYVGDPAPNDAISLALGAYAPQTTGEIIGLGSFRNNLFVFFEGALVIVEVGIFEGAVHKPKVQDTILENGIINHRTMVATKSDFLFADMLGVHTASRNMYGLMETKSVSELIDPAYQVAAPFAVAERPRAFSLLNKLENRMFTFVPDGADMIVWSMSFKEGVKQPAWSRYRGWGFTAGCVSEKGRIFFAKGTKIFQYGNRVFEDEDWSADFVGEFDAVWAPTTAYVVGQRLKQGNTVYQVKKAHTSDVFSSDLEQELLGEYFGDPIEFDWELPWTDLSNRALKKGMRYIQADTEGTARFSIDIFVDKYYKDLDGNYDPAVTMSFVGGSSGGYGNLDQPFGGGRRLRDERPWGLPADFKTMKLRVHGKTTQPLRIFTMTIYYLTGSMRR